MSEKKVCLPPASKRLSVVVPGRKRKVVAYKDSDGSVRRWNARARVMNGQCLKTPGGLGKGDLVRNKNGRIVSKAKADSAKHGKGSAARMCALEKWRNACRSLGYLSKSKPGFPKKGSVDHKKALSVMNTGCKKVPSAKKAPVRRRASSVKRATPAAPTRRQPARKVKKSSCPPCPRK